MGFRLNIRVIAALICVFILGCNNNRTAQNKTKITEPVHVLTNHGIVRNWLIVGPFPNTSETDTPGENTFSPGFHNDFLKSLKGENKAVIKADTVVEYIDKKNVKSVARTYRVTARADGIIDLDSFFNHPDNKIAYAFTYFYSDKPQRIGISLGSDDGVKVWINNRLVHSNDVGRNLVPGQDTFSVNLNQGLNPVLVKVTDLVRDWGFIIETLDEDTFAAIETNKHKFVDTLDFLNCKVVPKFGNAWDYTFKPGKFPVVDWDKPYLAKRVIGNFPLTVQWFDREMKEVTTPDKPGRYAFIAQTTTPTGQNITRASTVYCAPENWLAWSLRPQANLDYLHANYISKETWTQNKSAINTYAGRMVLLSILKQQEGAILMSFLDDMQSGQYKPSPLNTPIIRDHDYHLSLKRKILGIDKKYIPLKMPRKVTTNPAPMLSDGSEQQAGFKPGTADKIRNICSQWYEQSGQPFSICIARGSVVIIHQAFGNDYNGQAITTERQFPLASITKLITGMMFAQFIDQGLINIDDPVGKYLPDFPTKGDNVITLRNCYTHTTGLQGHEEWGGMHNPWLDNVIANITPFLNPGKVHIYNGMGYDLAGKVMESVSGKSIFRLMHENFFVPLGNQDTVLQEDLGFSCNTTALDLARFGQLLLNKGTYGDKQFFSEDTFEKLLPQPLSKLYPGINVDWGIGLTWMRQQHPEAGKNGVAIDETILSKNVIGHGSATSAILRVDLDNDLVIAQTRPMGGKHYEKNLQKLLIAIEDGLDRDN